MSSSTLGKKKHFIIKWYSILVYSSIVLHGTRVYHDRVPHNFFLIAQFPPQQCHGGKTSRNSSLRNSSTTKSGIFLYSSKTVFFYKKKILKLVVFGHFGHNLSLSWIFFASTSVTIFRACVCYPMLRFNWITATANSCEVRGS